MHPIPTLLLLLPVLASIILHVAIATTNATNCEPAKCGNLTIKYPFSLAGKQPLDCGYLPFQLSCDEANRTYLTRTFREHLYRVAEIFYENSSMVVAVETIFRGDSNCSVPDFNINSSLSLFPLSVNATNKNLIFVYDCNLPPPGRAPELSLLSCGVDKKKMGAYLTQEWDGNNSNVPQYLPNNCSFQIVPVRGFGGANASRYEQLIRDGFLLEWYALGDCRTCEQIGGQCRFSGEKVQFLCFCPHGGAGLRCTNSTSGDARHNIKVILIDFGLAKLCHLKDSVLSMAEARGTIGFIAPEVFSRGFGIVSTKSDVYSYGMVLLEMVGGGKSLKENNGSSSEAYFPNWIYDHLQKELQSREVTCATEEISRKMTIVGLWCIQATPGNRPSMSRVIEMLERSINELEMPPKPFLSCPSQALYVSSHSS